MENIENKILDTIISILYNGLKNKIYQLYNVFKSNIHWLLYRRKKSFYDLEKKFIEENTEIISENDKKELIEKTYNFFIRRKILPLLFSNLSRLRKMARHNNLDFISCFDLLNKIKYYNEDNLFIGINSLSNDWRIIMRMHDSIEKEIIKKMTEKNVFDGYVYVDINDEKLNKDINHYEAYMSYWEKSNVWINKQMLKYRRFTTSPLTILDVGCGNGRIIKEFAKTGDEIFLVEPDKERLKQAFSVLRENGVENIHTYECFIEDFDDSSCKADIIICSHVLQHLSINTVKMTIAKLRNCLNDNGVIFLLLPLSFSDYSEFVVHGLEFNIKKIRKDMYDNYKYIEDLLKKEGYNIPLENHHDEINDNYKDLCVNNNVYYSISKREDCAFIYERIYDQGLLYSVEKKDNINEQFELFNKKNHEYSLFEYDLTFSPTSFSRCYLLSDENKKKYIYVKDIKNNCIKIYDNVLPLISYHVVYEKLLAKEVIPEILLKILMLKRNDVELVTIQKKYWQIKKRKSQLVVAIIIQTQNYFSIATNDVNICDIPDLKDPTMVFNKFNIIDSEVPEGYWGKDKNGAIKIFIRNDSDWYRAFARTNDLPLNLISEIIKNGKCLIEGENIKCETIIENKIWRISQIEKPHKKVLPNYIIIANNETFKDCFIYRDKKYNRISRNTFNLLCTQEQLIRYKILPTHHFLYKELRKDLMINKLKISHLFSYHLNKKF